MKFVNKYLTFFIVAATFLSCEGNMDFDDYNQLPQDEFWKTSEHAMQALTACYGSFTSDWSYFDPTIMGAEEMASDNTSKGGINGTQGNGDLNTFADFSFTPSLARFNSLWKSRYSTINLCNQVLRYVPDIEMNETEKKEVLGEASFIRAWCYFELVRLFGEVVIYDGLPEGGAYDIPKSSVEDVYQFILKDLKFGFNNMRRTTWENEWKGRVTAWAARALEAKVLMYMASGENFMENNQAIGGVTWKDVETVTNDVITNGIYDLFTAKADSSFYYLFRLENENCIESIFESQNGVSGDRLASGSAYAYNSWIKGSSDAGFGYSVPSDKLVEAWQKRYETQNDLRYLYSIVWDGERLVDYHDKNGNLVQDIVVAAPVVDGITGKARFNKKVYIPRDERCDYKKDWYLTQIEQNQRLFRFADILLIDAEAKLRTGNEGGALLSINRVRQRAGEEELESLTLQQIWDERRFEFVFENDRYFDLVRTGEAKTVLAYKNWKFPKNVFYPIPQDQLDLSNNVLKQNPNWE
ncbi:RagB/SusD family nutrient uptake outer membrane protein [Bacteroides xylanisolvens]|uniref:RagB/SusD family nutrient uptake outer membrane protein n=1 Tax=Bacteroides xylanisolvens TaxID=371601 RepID=UPI0039B69BCD